jgi:hypothetical protein
MPMVASRCTGTCDSGSDAALQNSTAAAKCALPVQNTYKVLSPCFHNQPEMLLSFIFVKSIRARRISPAFAARSSGAGSMAASSENKI